MGEWIASLQSHEHIINQTVEKCWAHQVVLFLQLRWTLSLAGNCWESMTKEGKEQGLWWLQILNILGWAPNSGIHVKGCFSLLHTLRESLKEAVQRQSEDHWSPLPHTSWPKIGEEIVKNINKGKQIQKDWKEVPIKQKLETGIS